MKTELEYLKNAVISSNITGLQVHENFEQDKRKKINRFFLTINKISISPVLDYTNMNHFILGLSTAYKLTNDKITTNVKTFIKAFGIDNLNNKTVEQNGKKYKIELSAQDLEYHSINNPDWGGSKERLDKYHENGNFRFYAMDENQMCIWVYPTTDLLIDN